MALSNKGLSIDLQLKKMFKKCLTSVILLRKSSYYRQRSCSTCFFNWRNCLSISSEARCYVLFPFISEKIHSLSTSGKPLLVTLLTVTFRVLLFCSLYPLDVQLCQPCFPCCINAIFKAQLLDIFYSQIPFPDRGPEFGNNVARWVCAASPPMLPQTPHF